MTDATRPTGDAPSVMVPRYDFSVDELLDEAQRRVIDGDLGAPGGRVGTLGDLTAAGIILSMRDVIRMLAAAPQQSPGGEGWPDISTAPKDGTLFVGCNLDHPSFGSWAMYRRVSHSISDGGEMVTTDLGGWAHVSDLEPDYQEGRDTGPDPHYSVAHDAYNTSVRYGWRPLPSPPVPSVPQDHGSSLRDTHRGAETAVLDEREVGR